MGLCARGIRKIVGASKVEVAVSTSVDPYLIVAFESGMVPYGEMPERFHQYWENIIRSRLGNGLSELCGIPGQ